jgi:hypothetical protein
VVLWWCSDVKSSPVLVSRPTGRNSPGNPVRSRTPLHTAGATGPILLPGSTGTDSFHGHHPARVGTPGGSGGTGTVPGLNDPAEHSPKPGTSGEGKTRASTLGNAGAGAHAAQGGHGLGLTFADVVANPVTLEVFKDECARAHNSENVMFLMDVLAYDRAEEPADRRMIGEDIARTYLSDGASQPINIAMTQRETILQQVTAGTFRTCKHDAAHSGGSHVACALT